MFDTIIIGAGPAGLSTAIYNATEGRDSLILERSHIGGQARQSARIENYLGHPRGISGKQLARLAHRQAVEFGAKFANVGAVAIGVDGPTRLVQTDDDRIIAARSIVVASGLQYRRLTIPGAESFGVFYGANPDEAPTWAGKRIAIVGGANSAGQAAVNFASYASAVVVLSRSPLDKGMSSYLRDRIAGLPNVSVLAATPQSIRELPGPALEITTDAGAVVVDGAFLFIGAVPSCDWLPCAKDEHGFIRSGVAPDGERSPVPVRQHETTIPGVFVVGDVRSGSSKRIAAAVGEGAAVAAQLRDYLGGLE